MGEFQCQLTAGLVTSLLQAVALFWTMQRCGCVGRSPQVGGRMWKWLARKGEDSRVYMCIKEVKSVLAKADSLKRATILALAQIFPRFTWKSDDEIEDIFDRPTDYSRQTLLRIYTGLEDIRNHSKAGFARMRANHPRIVGIELPLFMVEHASATARGIEVWMCTLGAGLSPHRRDDVHAIWNHLASSHNCIDQAIAHLREVERRTAELSGRSGGQYGQFPIIDSDWRELCLYVPAIFSETPGSRGRGPIA